ncbi:MAG: 6-phosphofructokinase [Candidatus Aminicenantales bacterium]|jgi:6-phosphofructokinase 1
MKKCIGILTGGGDVPPLNAVIAAAKRAAEDEKINIVGFLDGWNGVLESNFVELNKVKIDPLIGGTILRSSRVNISRAENGISRALANLEREALDGLIVIGGEDTLSNCFLLKAFPQVMISKTIDNDVGRINREGDIETKKVFNYFTLGFPTAADKIASFVSYREGLRTTAYSHERIMIVESMGMHAGWLALASGMGRPDFIVIPEFPVSYDILLEKIIDRYKKQRHVIVVVAEGAKWDDDSYIHAGKDDLEGFDHPRFGGAAAAVAAKLKKDIQGRFDTRNINAINPSYLYRSGAPISVDKKAAEILGEKAVRLLAGRVKEPTFLHIQKKERGFSAIPSPLSTFRSIQDLHRFVDSRFYDPKEFSITETARRYLEDFVKDRPSPKNYGLNPLGGKNHGIC